jgi:hypothetical protein
MLLDDGGIVTMVTSSAAGGEARGEVRYPPDRSKTKPKDSNIDATRNKHDTKTGMRCDSRAVPSDK